MCNQDSFMSRLKKNHELHGIVIGLLLYWQSKNMILSFGVGGLIYYAMMMKEKKQMKKEYCGCDEKKVDSVKVNEKTNVNNYSFPWSVM